MMFNLFRSETGEIFTGSTTFYLSPAFSCSSTPVDSPCSVRPASRFSACGSTGRIAASELLAPAGLPGRFTINAVPSVPHTPRLSEASGVYSSPSALIRSASPSISRSQTIRVASGVTSRVANPVPPVVTIRSTTFALRHSAAAIWSSSSGNTSLTNPSALQHLAHRRPRQIHALAP